MDLINFEHLNLHEFFGIESVLRDAKIRITGCNILGRMQVVGFISSSRVHPPAFIGSNYSSKHFEAFPKAFEEDLLTDIITDENMFNFIRFGYEIHSTKG